MECPATPADREDSKFQELEEAKSQWMDLESVVQALDQAAKVDSDLNNSELKSDKKYNPTRY